MSLSPEAVNDLAVLATRRVEDAMESVLQLVDDPKDRVSVATRAAAFAFGSCARFAMEVLKSDPEFAASGVTIEACCDHVTRLIADITKKHFAAENGGLQPKVSDHQS